LRSWKQNLKPLAAHTVVYQGQRPVVSNSFSPRNPSKRQLELFQAHIGGGLSIPNKSEEGSVLWWTGPLASTPSRDNHLPARHHELEESNSEQGLSVLGERS